MKITDLLLTADKQYSEVLEVGGTLTLDPSKNITLSVSQNILNSGKIVSKPGKGVIHTIRFTGIDEKKFVGGGDGPLDTDTGLWTIGAGQLDFDGTAGRTPWTRAKSALVKGSSVLPVIACDNWQPGDELVIAPTAEGDFVAEERKVVSVNGTLVTIDKPLSNDHPSIDGNFPEVFNMTRNVRIEGTPTGFAHTFIKSSKPQSILGVQYRYMGPRKDIGGSSVTEKILGRYVIHFHHSEDGSRGSEIEDCVARDCNSPFMVPHGSHGIMWCDNFSYNCAEQTAWYDPGHATHDNTFEDCFSVCSRFFAGSLQPEDGSPLFGGGGFLIGMGDNNIYRRCWVIGGGGGDTRADYIGGFEWRAKEGDGAGGLRNEGVAIFEDCGAHNYNSTALRGWQNTDLNHLITRFNTYHCKVGIFLGAYGNCYKFLSGRHYKSPIIIHAGATGGGIFFTDMAILYGGKGDKDNIANVSAGIFIEGSPVEEERPITLLNITFQNCVNDVYDSGSEKVHNVDIINCTGSKYTATGGAKIRVQAKGQTGFAPTIWGTGTGLLGEYFGDTSFKNKLFERVENIAFPEWIWGVHHLLDGKNFSARWTGFMEVQFNESYSFRFALDGGSATLYIDDKKVTGAIALKPGTKYKARVDYISDGKPGIVWIWNCPSLGKWNSAEYVPLYQLYTSGTVTPPTNQPPKANAGPDQTITLPISSTVLNGTGSDADGVIKSYLWTKQSGPAGFLIANPSNPSTQITGLTEGVYTFALAVTDDKGGTASDTVTVTVKPVVTQPNQPPVVTASATANVIKTGTIFLNGGATDPEGGALTYLWQQVSGTSVTIQNPTSAVTTVPNAPAGNYIFTLTVTDNKGAKTSANVSQTI